jgi:Ca-activated chloride channel family protein
MIADFHFLRPWWLLALVLPPMIVWLASRRGDIRSRWKGLIAPHLLDRLVIEPDHRKHMTPAWATAALAALAVLGVAGPAWQREVPPFVSDTASLVIAVDLSPTMDAVDITPSRLERAKLKIRDMLAARRGARTAVIAYSGTAHVVVPLTEDDALIENYTDALATRIMPRPGKDTATALRLAERMLKEDGSPGTILLLTDGVEASASVTSGEIGRGVVVLGIGTVEGGLVKPPDGGFLSGANGARQVAKLDLDGLKAFADKTGAALATVTDDDADIRWAAQHVSTNFARQQTKEGDRWRDAGWWLLLPVALLLAFSFRRGWVVKVSAVVLAARVLVPGSAEAADMLDPWLTPDQQGRLAFERGDFARAGETFQNPMWKGVALYRLGKYQQAFESFVLVDTAESSFDQGNALLHLGRFADAVDAYHKALERRKDWPEAAADLVIAERLLKQQQQDDEDQPQDPNEKPDSVQFDDKGKQGKAETISAAEETSEMWMKNIQTSPADLMARTFAIEDEGTKP